MSDQSGVVVDQPTMQDIDSLVELWVRLASGQRRHGSHLEAEANRSRIRESISRQIALREIHIARHADDIVGFVMYTIEGSTFTRSATRGVIQNLYVDPAFRDQGIGTELLRAGEATLEDAGADVLGLQVMASNEAARRFYARHGYDVHRLTMEKSTENDTA